MRRRAACLSLILLLCFQFPASAGLDVYGTGTGRDGAVTILAAGTVINRYAQVTSSVAAGDKVISIGALSGAAGGIASGDLVMVWQATGLVPEPASGASGPFDLTSGAVGRWELARVAAATTSSLTLTEPLLYSYAANYTQVVRVPEYTSVTINASQSIAAKAWDGSTGGIVAFLVTGTILNSGSIIATGLGFRGGQYVNDESGYRGANGLDEAAPWGAQKGEGVVATRYGASYTGRGNIVNGAGGGVAYRAGGGGGGNAGAGGRGGNSDISDGNRVAGGYGGASVSYNALDHLLMGGGGGAGHGDAATGKSGAAGGGVIFIRCNQLAGMGNLFANGGNAANSSSDGASGGGAGGTIYLRTIGTATFTSLFANGGNGGNISDQPDVGPGGGGGGGSILLQRCSSGGGSFRSLGGSSGIQTDLSAVGGPPYNAMSGINGNTVTLADCMEVPSMPTISMPAEGAVTGDPFFIFGTGPANTNIALYLDGVLLITVATDAVGNYVYTVPGTVADGAHTLKAYANTLGLYSEPASVSFTAGVTLPIRLVAFTASKKGNSVALEWQTSGEWNSERFVVEKSVDGNRYIAVGELAATGYASTVQTYGFTDSEPAAGMNYYRLKNIDKDGQYTYSSILAIRFNQEKDFDVFPNPATAIVHLQVKTPAGPVRIQVLDVSGRVMQSQQFFSSGSTLSASLNIQALQPGIYYIQAGSKKRKLVKQ